MGCLKRDPTGEKSFYPERLEAVHRLRGRNGWPGTLGKSETDDNPGNGNRQHAGEPSRIGPACACDAPVKELIAKPTLSHFGFGYTG